MARLPEKKMPGDPGYGEPEVKLTRKETIVYNLVALTAFGGIVYGCWWVASNLLAWRISIM